MEIGRSKKALHPPRLSNGHCALKKVTDLNKRCRSPLADNAMRSRPVTSGGQGYYDSNQSIVIMAVISLERLAHSDAGCLRAE